MTTVTAFMPSAIVPFSFSPTLDGAQYSAVVTWGLAGQRWYVNLYDQGGNLIFYLPAIGSPTAIQTASLTWDGVQNLVTVITAVPHGLPIGITAELTITGVSPASYNGIWDLFSTGPSTLTFPLSVDPGGDATVNGNVGRDINIAGGYFETSTFVFREATQNFEVTP
jgi:hypothetical protein